MATWIEPGSFSGVNIVSGSTALRDIPNVFSTAGAQDSNTITRLQVNVTGSPSTPDRLVAKVKFRYVETDGSGYGVLTPVGAWGWWGAMFITPDSALNYPAGSRPTIHQIMSSPQAKVYRGTRTYSSAYDLHFTINGPRANALSPGTKYWVAVMPTYSRIGTGSNANGHGDKSGTPNYTNDKIINPGQQETLGRAISFWTNRSPGKPTITSPAHRSVVDPGSTFTLSATFPDPDSLGTVSQHHSGIIGAQAQYARQPTGPDDTPEWMDLPIGVFGRVDPGWTITGTNVPNAPYGAAGLLPGGGGLLVRAGRAPAPSAEPNGFLPPGDWQIRVRGFDQGNPATYIASNVRPLNGVAQNYVPEGSVASGQVAYPSFNTSPWSDPIFVTVPVRVPPPIPVSPKDRVAVPANKAITFRWRYRNTASTDNIQKTYRVEVRKVGDPEWTAIDSQSPLTSSGHQISNNNYTTIVPSEAARFIQAPMRDYGFEEGTLGDFEPSGFGYPSGVTVTLNNVAGTAVGDAAEGNRALVISQTGATPASGTFGFQTKALPVQPGINKVFMRGMIKGNSPLAGLGIRFLFYDASMALLSTSGAGAVTYTAGNWFFTGMNLTPSSETVRQNTRFVRVQFIHTPGSASLDGVRLDALSLDVEPILAEDEGLSYPFVSGNEYEWRVRVSDASNSYSFPSAPARFWVVAPPGSGGARPLPAETVDGATLGCGKHRVFIYRRGGKVRVGELTGLSSVNWGRVRDDISTAKVVVKDWGVDCGNLLSKLQTWAYEMVIFRDNGYTVDRVWEGPITRLTYERDTVTIHAKDVMVHPYRRILKQRMSDAGTGSTVVDRAVRVLQNAFAPDDPNVLPYLMPLDDANESAKQYRVTPAYSRTAFEEVDDMAANAGLDYTVVGRSILLWGTKQRVGTLPEFRDEDLGSTPIVSEYGMSMANRYAVSDGNGVYGEADRLDADGKDETYGLVEMLSSTWASDSAGTDGTYTEAALETTRESFKDFSERSIADRYPPPVVVRIPANTSLSPDAVVSIQHLVPGVVIPLRSYGTLRTVVANQKLDSVNVVEEDGKETISITVSPFSRDDASTDTEVLE